jgi:hypothetical protein
MIVYDTQTRSARRMLERQSLGHRSPVPDRRARHPDGAPGRVVQDASRARLVRARWNGEWLYYGAMSNDTLYRVRTKEDPLFTT